MAEEQPKHNAVEPPEPDPAREQPAEPDRDDRPVGERQDGAGAGPRRAERTDATPVGSTAAQRTGQGPTASREDRSSTHRGEPATFATGAAQGSGSGAGGGGAGEREEFDSDSSGGGDRQ